jgi:glycosyltransferase involved in cell wall biosynthesis/Flp pilus assembly protein TadD
VALRIVRATEDQSVQRPIRLWFGGRHDDAIAALASPDGGQYAEDAAELLRLALAERGDHAARIGRALCTWSDDVAAYRALRATVEALIDETASLGPQAWLPRGVAILELVEPWLTRRPAEPVLLNYLGVTLYGLNEATLALPILQTAQRLDPTLENVGGNIAAARARIKRPVTSVTGPREARAIKALRSFLKALAGRAVAQRDDVRISLCMIVRDEEEMLPECLASCAAGVDELIIVDTGSTDGTIAIAESFGATVLHFPWNGSFSDARNHGIEAATGTHVLWLDADERLEEGDAERLHALAAQPYREAHWLVETNFTGQDEVGTAANHLALRLWRNRPPYRFTGAIHEQIRVHMPVDLPERFAISSLRIRHYGYLKSRIDERNKHERNLKLLEQELATNPSSAFTHFNLGTEYVSIGDAPKASTHLEESFRLLQREDAWHEIAYASLLATRLVGIRRTVGDLDGADRLAVQLLGLYPAFTDLVYERGLVARERRQWAAAAAHFQTCLEMGDAPARYAGMVGRGTFLALAALAAVAADAGDQDRAVAYLEESLDRFPTYLPAGLDLADNLLAAADADPELVLARLEQAPNEQATWWLFLGTAFYERGHAAIAERLFRRALGKAPSHPAASVGLLEALLTQHRYDDVAAEAPDLPTGTPAFFAVERSLVLALALVGDGARAADAAAAFGAGGGDGAELAFLEAFAQIAAGGSPRIPTGAAPYAIRMLDSLARLEEFEAFEQLLPAATRSVGDERIAALLVAELFLARGFYRLAADQALASMDIGGPEPRALGVLGKAAVAEGLFEDAIPVLEASLELDPTQTPVRTLLAELRTRVAA